MLWNTDNVNTCVLSKGAATEDTGFGSLQKINDVSPHKNIFTINMSFIIRDAKVGC